MEKTLKTAVTSCCTSETPSLLAKKSHERTARLKTYIHLGTSRLLKPFRLNILNSCVYKYSTQLFSTLANTQTRLEHSGCPWLSKPATNPCKTILLCQQLTGLTEGLTIHLLCPSASPFHLYGKTSKEIWRREGGTKAFIFWIAKL